MEETKKKLTFLQKVENFWYYYKWWVILGVIFLIGIIVGMRFVSENTKQKPSDVNVFSVFANVLTADDYNIDERLKDYIIDVNQDGSKDVALNTHYITEKQTSSDDQLAKGQFESELSKCSGGVMLFDTPNLNAFLSKDIFEPIENYIDISQIPKENIVYKDDVAVAVRLEKSQILTDMKFFVDQVYVSVMFLPDEPSEEDLKKNENAKIIVSKLLEKTTE